MSDPVQRGRLVEVLRPLVGEAYADYDILSVKFTDIVCVENADGTFSPVVYLGNDVQQWPLDDEGGSAAYVEMAVRDIDGNSNNFSVDLTPADFSAFASILSVRSIDLTTKEDTLVVFSNPVEATAAVRALPELTDTVLTTFEYNLTNPWRFGLLEGGRYYVDSAPADGNVVRYLESLGYNYQELKEKHATLTLDSSVLIILPANDEGEVAILCHDADFLVDDEGSTFEMVINIGDEVASTPDIDFNTFVSFIDEGYIGIGDLKYYNIDKFNKVTFQNYMDMGDVSLRPAYLELWQPL